jgi:hypothetical protein
MAASALRAFSPREVVLCTVFGVLFESLLLVGIVLSGSTKTQILERQEAQEIAIPIAVQPVLDDLPLLKLGSKKDKLKPRLPDMWRKRDPTPVRRLEERSAPSELAEDNVDKVAKSDVADKDHPAPDEDDELVKEVEQTLEEDEAQNVPELSEEGAERDLYRMKVIGWLNVRFQPPKDQVPCEVLRTLSAVVTVQVGGDRSVASFSVASPSGNAVFDASVQATMNAMVGQILPPPPELYPDILGSSVTTRMSGAGVCPKSTEDAPAP